jgi:hypothetical protein
MSLPKIQYPIFELILPSTKETVKFRPFTVKEEKLLLIAQESEEQRDRLNAMKQIINNCCLNLSKNIDDLPSFDLEYCFLKIRSKSVSNIIELKYRDNTDEKIYSFEVDLDEVEVVFNESHNPMISISDNLNLTLTYPTIEMLKDVIIDPQNPESILKIIKKCISIIYDDETVYDPAEYSDDELTAFVESIPAKAFESIVEFFVTMPVLKHDLHYKDSQGTEKTITLQGIDDFFQ